jgi:thiamine-monophosphate kinase
LLEENIIKSLFNNKYPDDDCYFLNKKYLVTTDTIIEGTHFNHAWSNPEYLAEKLVEVNISDIAASGGSKKGFAFLNLGLSKTSSEDVWIKSFNDTLLKRLKYYNHKLCGGDSFYSRNTSLNLTLISENSFQIKRSSAKQNDKLFITGPVGFSNLGFRILKKKLKIKDREIYDLALKKHLSPVSRFFEMRKIQKQNTIHSMIDISDGLYQDAEKIALASRKDVFIHIEKIPQFYRLRKFLTIEQIITSGEELELLFSAKDIKKESKQAVTEIGFVRNGTGKVVFLFEGVEFVPKKKGFQHFSK